jgi:hypothetical protein
VIPTYQRAKPDQLVYKAQKNLDECVVRPVNEYSTEKINRLLKNRYEEQSLTSERLSVPKLRRTKCQIRDRNESEASELIKELKK